MKAIETTAVFDENGRMTVDSVPALKNKHVRLLILVDEDDDDFRALSMNGLSKAYAADEPEYDLNTLKEPNPGYVTR